MLYFSLVSKILFKDSMCNFAELKYVMHTLIQNLCLQGMYTSLACSKHGSRSLEALWKVASINIKTHICRELVTDELKMKDSAFGKIIYSKFKVMFAVVSIASFPFENK